MRSTFLIYLGGVAGVFLVHPLEVAAAGDYSEYLIAERGPHHRVFHRISYETNELSVVIGITNVYTELASGLHYFEEGHWLETREKMEILADGSGVVADKGPHKVRLAANLKSATAVEVVTPDQKRLTGRIVGLSYFDSRNGRAVLIAGVQDSIGLLVGDSRVLYTNAFDDVEADVEYIYTRSGIEQNIILRSEPPSPVEWGLHIESTRLQVLTEFFDPPRPGKRAELAAGQVDESLDFGSMQIGKGRAFLLGEEEESLPVTKQWTVLEGRTFLVEEVPFQRVKTQLKRLERSKRTAGLNLNRQGQGGNAIVALQAHLVAQPTDFVSGKVQLAQLDRPRAGFLLDYALLTSQTNFTFAADQTYYASGLVNLSGTTRFEGGTVVKFAPTNSARLSLNGPSLWESAMYRPCVFTARDDNSVGDTILGSTGNPTTNYYGDPAILDNYSIGGTTVMTGLRVSYAKRAIDLYYGSWTPVFLKHSQIVGCKTGLGNLYGEDSADIHLSNVLFYNVSNVFAVPDVNLHGDHVTINQASMVAPSGINLTNCLVVTTNAFTCNGVGNVVLNNANGVFQTVGGGSHYLADNSPYRNSGSTNISSSLRAELKKRTTYPPFVIPSISVNTVLSPQAARDSNVPDLGYHYDPMDWVVSGTILTNVLVLTNGAVLGTYCSNANQGLLINSGGKLFSQGTATTRNYIVRYNTAQEQATTNWASSTVGPSVKSTSNVAPVPEGRFRFTSWSLLGANGYHVSTTSSSSVGNLKDCEFAGGIFNSRESDLRATNCLWQRVYLSLDDHHRTSFRNFFNNLFRAGSFDMASKIADNWLLYDNLFDRTLIYGEQDGSSANYNGYVTNFTRLYPEGANDKILTNAPAYHTSHLGRFYYPTNDGMLSLLINAGSRNATNAGLYHFTTTTNQVKEAASVVDIGFHYASTDAGGNPLDSDGDGFPDYLEDLNGNGNGADDPSSWLSYSSPYGLTGVTGLQVFTPLR